MIGRSFDFDVDAYFLPAMQPQPDRMCARLAARFGGVDLPLLRRIAAQESAAAQHLLAAVLLPTRSTLDPQKEP